MHLAADQIIEAGLTRSLQSIGAGKAIGWRYFETVTQIARILIMTEAMTGICKDLILDLDLMAARTPFNLCMLLLLPTTLSSPSLGHHKCLLFLLNSSSLIQWLSTCLGPGRRLNHLMQLATGLQMVLCHPTVLVKLVLLSGLLFSCMLPSNMLCLHAQESHLYIHRIPCDHLHRLSTNNNLKLVYA